MSTENEPTVLTIGHSNHPIERFVELLRKHGFTAVADVRSAPYSRHQPQFNKDPLQRSLKDAGIAYIFLGKELGARSEDRSCYEKGRVQYRRLAQTDSFRRGIERVRKGAGEYRVALMCAEKEPLDCHRTLLVSRALEREGVSVAHILADGRLEVHHDAMMRLLDVVGLDAKDMFQNPDELIEEACAKQEERVAYVDEQLARETSEIKQ
jgi:uncharacterized protein (DUF488 family)